MSEEALKQYKVGQWVWTLESQSRGAWRAGIVKEIQTHDTDGVKLHQSSQYLIATNPITKQQSWVRSWGLESHVMPRAVVPTAPDTVVYLVDTKIGEALSQRIGDMHFSVYEAGTRMATKGHLLNYIILPGWMYECRRVWQNPAYKTWVVPPNVFELLSFLGAKMPEICDLHHELFG